jgi:hypothetical protein
MSKSLIRILTKFRKTRYQRAILTKKQINQRDILVKYFFDLDGNFLIKKINCNSCNFYSKNLNIKNFIIFYKKFNSNLVLKENYNLSNYKKKSNKNACINSYILLSQYMKKYKRLNTIQKLNTLLKINDLLILNFKTSNHSHLLKNLKTNLKYEKKLLKLYS